ncbi:MAG: HypC/HybG/HupF family hydrogenase formation chaperone [Lachnospiraceae bacterium]|nr:HypC/HybG/HupF family hydrogenase formation chaperone [Lachnospiraceae bacterium]
MCVAYPGTVIAVRPAEHKATVDFSGTTVDALTGVSDIKEGDRVLVHAGCVIRVLQEQEADELTELFKELEEAIRS